MRSLLTRRRVLLLAALAPLAACRPPRRQRLLAPPGLLPSPLLRSLPAGWMAADWTPPVKATTPVWPADAAMLALPDGWATAWEPSRVGGWSGLDLEADLLPQARPLLRWGLPLAFGPWLIVLRDRPDLTGQDWSLLLDPGLRGRLLLPAAPRLVLDLAERLGDPERSLSLLRRQARGFSDRDALTLLLQGEADGAVLPSQVVVPLLRRDPRLRAVLPATGSPLWWVMLLRPPQAPPPPLAWLQQQRRPPLLAQLLRAGFTPPLRRALLAAALAGLPGAELQYPSDALLSRCSTLMPFSPEQRSAAEALWRASAP
ncbi:MAG: hypothetical protein ACOYMY_07700 [Prochlorococcaceae cyanobacterium]|jgi:hypothetical protein